jgi:hypothetical protein
VEQVMRRPCGIRHSEGPEAVARAGDRALGHDPVKCEIEFYHEARAAFDAERPAGTPRRWLSLFERAQRIGNQDPSGWRLHRIAAR